MTPLAIGGDYTVPHTHLASYLPVVVLHRVMVVIMVVINPNKSDRYCIFTKSPSKQDTCSTTSLTGNVILVRLQTLWN